LRNIDKLLRRNFQIIFRSGKSNGKADAIIRTGSENIEEKPEQWAPLTSDHIRVEAIEVEQELYHRIHESNKADSLLEEYRQAIQRTDKIHNRVKFRSCRMIHNALYNKGGLWVPEHFYTEILQDVHD